MTEIPENPLPRRLSPVPIFLVACAMAMAAGAAEVAREGDRHRVASARAKLAALNVEDTDLAARIGHNRAELARVLGALQLFGRQPPPALLVAPSDVKDSVRAAILIRAIAPTLEERARTLSMQAGVLAAVRRKAAAANGDLFAAESAQEDRRSRLEGVMSDAESLSPPSTRATAQPAAKETPPANMIQPAAGRRTAGFVGRLADGTRSHGLVLATDPGAAVVSPAGAVVDYAGPLNGWGLVVILRAPGGCHMVLSGLGKLLVGAGQSVAAGQVVGAMPKHAQSSRELYFEVRLGGAPVDPARFLAGTSPKTTPRPLRGAVSPG